MNTSLATTANELLKKTELLEQRLKVPIDELSRQSNRLFEAAAIVAQSWSGSFFGYHSELYYSDFERPPLERRFSPEWGGIHGVPPGWRTRGAEEVKTQIETLAKAEFDGLELKTKQITREAQEVQSEILVGLSPLRAVEGFESEKALMAEIESFKWETKAAAFAHENIPKHLMSRDSSAVAEGAKMPPHLYYEAEAHECLSRCTFLPEFLKLAKRCLGQVQTQMTYLTTENRPRIPDSLRLVSIVCNRFHLAAKQLQDRHEKRQTLQIKDEYDVQDFLHSLLRLHFDDIRQEEWTPSYAGTSSKMDFLLKSEQIVIEVKMTRVGRSNREITDELLVDVARYKSHQDCKVLVSFIYDPLGLIKNPRGFEHDLAQLSDSRFRVLPIISP
jgi:hypothetical protein